MVNHLVREATPRDQEAIELLLAAADLPVGGVVESLRTFVVAEQNGRVVAVAGLELHGEFALLRSVAVAPDARAHGLGTAVVERLLGLAGDLHLRSIYLLTTTAERYFPRFGFETVERADVPDPVRASAEFQDLCPASAVVMRRELPSAAGADA